MNDKIPPLIKQYGEYILDPKTPEHVKFNYYLTLEAIKDFAQRVLHEYDKTKSTIKTRR